MAALTSHHQSSIPAPVGRQASVRRARSLSSRTRASSPHQLATPAKWTDSVAEVKRACLNRQYRQCSDQCENVLDRATATDSYPPAAYLVCLRFYAATALEMQARAAHHASPRRISLFQQAQTHYRLAADLARQADRIMASRDRGEIASPVPSLHSSSGSDASSSAPSTRVSSPTPSPPTPSLPSAQEPPRPKPRLRRKKHVSFRDSPAVQPFVRADSPTLGLNHHHDPSSPAPASPEPILKHQGLLPSAVPHMTAITRAAEPTDPFCHMRSVHRCCTILSSIRQQVLLHMAALDVEIAACQSSAAPDLSSNPELRALDARARIDRLRATGWQRPRFDARRYEALRQNALVELGG